MPTLPPEPPLFSTSHCWPVSSDILAQNRRDSVSVAPPAGKRIDVAHRLGRVGALGRDDGRCGKRAAQSGQHDTAPDGAS